MTQKPELLAPAGDMERLKVAIAYGADAVYLGGQQFSLRAGAVNFDNVAEAVDYAHAQSAKVYVAVNIFANNADIEALRGYFKALSEAGADAVIISDPGVLALAREEAPTLEVHISTQANITNYASALFWHRQGAARVILARELSLRDITEIHSHVPENLMLETFVHGAMCIAFSGRCLLSNYMTGRAANQGNCAHPCRYQYYVTEEKRPGQFLPVVEEERGVSIFSSNDLCMVAHLPELIAAGVGSLKIEGRMKTAYYVAVATQTYRKALDDLWDDPERYEANKSLYVHELEKCAHRGTPGFTSGFYFGAPGPDAQDYSGTPYTRSRVFAGMVTDYNAATGLAAVEQRNKFSVGDTIEIIRANGESFTQIVCDLRNEDSEPIKAAPHPRQKVWLAVEQPVKLWDMLALV